MKHLLLLLIFNANSLNGQTLQFQPTLRGTPLTLTDSGADAGAEIRIEAMRWYLSGFTLLQQGRVVYTAKDSHHLLDAAIPSSLKLSLGAPDALEYDAVRFTVGVDSLTAAGGAFDGDLDPTNGMYWTWRSGYINFKLEGTSRECPGRKNRFQYHIGGYQAPFNTTREVTLPTSTDDHTTVISVDLDVFFARVDIRKTYQIMSPNRAAMKAADDLSLIFRISTK